MVIIGSYEREKNIIENISLTGSYCIIQIAIKLSVCVNQRNLNWSVYLLRGQINTGNILILIGPLGYWLGQNDLSVIVRLL